jgi:cell division protein FtsL
VTGNQGGFSDRQNLRQYCQTHQMTIEIPDDLARGLEEIAVAQHKTVEQVAVERLRVSFGDPGSPASVLRLIRELPHPSPEAVDEMEAAIASARQPVDYRGIFDE